MLITKDSSHEEETIDFQIPLPLHDSDAPWKRYHFIAIMNYFLQDDRFDSLKTLLINEFPVTDIHVVDSETPWPHNVFRLQLVLAKDTFHYLGERDNNYRIAYFRGGKVLGSSTLDCPRRMMVQAIVNVVITYFKDLLAFPLEIWRIEELYKLKTLLADQKTRTTPTALAELLSRGLCYAKKTMQSPESVVLEGWSKGPRITCADIKCFLAGFSLSNCHIVVQDPTFQTLHDWRISGPVNSERDDVPGSQINDFSMNLVAEEHATVRFLPAIWLFVY